MGSIKPDQSLEVFSSWSQSELVKPLNAVLPDVCSRSRLSERLGKQH